MFDRRTVAHVDGHDHDGLRGHAIGEIRGHPRPSWRSFIRGISRHVRAEPDRPGDGSLNRSNVQFEREAAGANSFVVGKLGQGRPRRDRHQQDRSSDACADGWHNSLPCKFLHEQIP
jgi:hypothetical protein